MIEKKEQTKRWDNNTRWSLRKDSTRGSFLFATNRSLTCPETGVPPITRDWTPIEKEALNSQNEMVSHDQQREEETSKEVKQIA
jgi:hypothetical protein